MRPGGYVGVVGPGRATPQEVEQAREVGRLLACNGLVVVTGGLGGVMGGAAQGCHEAGGTSLGLLPGGDRTAADPHLTLTVPTGLGEMRNALLVRCCDAVVAVGTSWGTLSEISLAARTGVPTVVVGELPATHELARDDGAVPPVRAGSAQEAVTRVVELLRTEPAAEPHVLGVDGARGGWVGALLPVSGTGTVRLVHAPDIATLVQQAEVLTRVVVVAVDIPVGLPDAGVRQADVLARGRLGPRASSVFPTPVRDALAAETYAEARSVSLARTGGRSLAAQSYALRRAILDVDAYVRSARPVRVVEVHPELSFATMTGAPLTSRKKERAGADERLRALAAQGIRLPAGVDAGTRGVDDLLDAAAAAWSASRVARGSAGRLPAAPERFSDGLDATMWF